MWQEAGRKGDCRRPVALTESGRKDVMDKHDRKTIITKSAKEVFAFLLVEMSCFFHSNTAWLVSSFYDSPLCKINKKHFGRE